MFEKKKEIATPVIQEKPTPTFMREDYPYKALGEEITDWDSLVFNGVLYEIKCPKCEMSIRSQGCNVKKVYTRLVDGIEVKNEDGSTRIDGGKGCVGCGNRNLIVKIVDTSKMTQLQAKRDS